MNGGVGVDVCFMKKINFDVLRKMHCNFIYIISDWGPVEN